MNNNSQAERILKTLDETQQKAEQYMEKKSMSIKKRLGKIIEVEFGLGGYQGAAIGLHLVFEGKGWGTGFTKSYWDPNQIECSEHSQWTEQDRDKGFAEIVRYVSDILKDAKVQNVEELKGVPVEITFDGNTLKDWRVLTEVL